MNDPKTWGIPEAAIFLRIHPDTLAERARNGEIPGCKVGRAWVFMPNLLEEYVRCRSTVSPKARTTGSEYRSLAQKLGARRALQISRQHRNLNNKSENDSGDCTSSGTVVRLDSRMPPPVG